MHNLYTLKNASRHVLSAFVFSVFGVTTAQAQSPVANCVSATVAADQNCQVNVSAQAFNNSSYDPDGGNVSLSISPAGPFGLGTHSVTLNVTDDEGMTSSCTTTLTVVDGSGPAITPQDITVSLDANGQATIVPSDVMAAFGDNCDPNPTYTLSKSVFDCNDLASNLGAATPGTLSGTMTVDNQFNWYISTDDNVQGTFVTSGNDWTQAYSGTASLAAGQTYYIHIEATDVGGPEFFLGNFYLSGGFQFGNGTQTLRTNVSDWKVSTTGWGNYVNPFYVGDAGYQAPWYGATSSYYPAQLIWEGNWGTDGSETRYFTAPIYPVIPGSNVTITATDNAGNVTNVSANVFIEDNLAPVVNTMDAYVDLDASGNVSISVSDIDNGITDNCGIASITLSQTNFDCSHVDQTNVVTVTVEDVNGNINTGTANVYVRDLVGPSVSVNNITVQLDAFGNASITAADIDAGSTDACGVASLSLSQYAFSCHEAGTSVPVVLTVTDVNGQISSATAQVTVNAVQPIAPTADVFNMSAGQTLNISVADLIGNDTDPYGQTLTVDAITNVSSGTMVDNLNGTWTYTPASASNQVVTADYIVKRADGTLVFSENGHFYEFVASQGITWTNAKIAAEGRTYNGMQGYLVTVTSASEDAFVAQKLQGEGWMGASDSETEKTWKWVTGPEAGTVFYNQTSQSAVNGQYENWSNGEPNDYKYGNPFHPGEDYAHYYPTGVWNDYPNSAGSIAGYIVEYGGMANDCNSNSASSTGSITINVTDNVDPTVVTQNIIVDLDANGQVSITAGDIDNGSSDASGIASLSLDITSFDCNNTGNNTVTLTVTDNNGNSAQGTATVEVRDVTYPTAIANNVTVQLDVNGAGSITAADVDGGSSDNCGGITTSVDKTMFSCNDVGANTVTLSVLDASGNLSTATATVTVLDVQPVVANADAFTVNTGQSITFTAAQLLANDTDPYGQTLQVDGVSAASAGSLVDNYNGTFTYTPAGALNQTVTASYVVKRDDGTIVYTGNGHFYEFVVAPRITWTAAKVAAENRTYNGMQGYLATVTSSSEDAFVSQKLQGEGWIGASDAASEGNWKWVTGPEAGQQFWSGLWNGTPTNGMYNHWAGGEPNNAGDEDYAHYWSYGLWNDYPNYAGGISGYIVEYGGMPGDCQSAPATGSITINVIDVTPPTVATNNVTVYLDANGQASVTTGDIDNGSSDASGIASMSLDNSAFTCTDLGANTVTLTVVDNNGNSNSGTAVVTVVDNTNPSAVFAGGNFSLNSNRSVTITANDVIASYGDNCGVASVTLIGRSTYDCNDVDQTFTVSVEVVDNSGNITTVSGPISINDINTHCNEAPVAVCNSFTAPADGSCVAQVFAQAFNGGSYDPDGTIVSQTISPAGPFGLGTHQVTYTVTDNEGASSSCVATLTVTDQTGPSIATLTPTINLDANGQASIVTSDVVASATDNCSPNVNLTVSQTSFDCTDLIANIGNATPGTLSGSLTADNEFTVYISTDDNVQGTSFGSGNNWGAVYSANTPLAAGQKYYIHVAATDWGGPEFFAGKFTLTGGFQFANGTQSLNTNNADWQVSASGWNNYTNPIIVGQAGQQHSIWGNGVNTLSPAYLIWSGDWNTGGGETRYFTAEILPIIPGSAVTVTGTDGVGNTTTVNATVNIVDAIAPVAVVNNPTIVLDATGNATISLSDIDGGSSDNCGIVSSSIDVTSVDCSNLNATVPVTLTLFDASGNKTTAVANVTVVDTTSPNAVVASNIVVSLDGNGAGSLTAADVDGGSSDNCGVASTSIDVTSFSCADVGVVPVTLTVTDASGNVSTAVANVTVIDDVMPTVVCQNITVDLPQAGSVSITAAMVHVSSSDNCGIASMTVSPSSFDCSNEGANTVTLTVTDVNGNQSSCQAVVTVVKAPIVVQEVVSDFNGYGVSCNGGSNGSIDLTVSGACEPYSYAWSNGATTEDVSGLSAGSYSVAVTDGNGQTTNYSYVITEPTALAATKSMTPYQLVSGQLDSTIFLGYGPQSVDLDVSVSGGVAGYTYQWSPAAGLSNTSAATVTASPTTTTTYTVVATDMNGCTIQRSITVYVQDVRDPNNPSKILLCHLRKKKGQQTWGVISVSVNAVPAHLGHGDILGPCNDASKVDVASTDTEVELFHTEIFPNPTNNVSTLSIHTHEDVNVMISVCDARGSVISEVYNGQLQSEVDHEFTLSSSELPAGMYNVIVRTADGVETLRWIVVR